MCNAASHSPASTAPTLDSPCSQIVPFFLQWTKMWGNAYSTEDGMVTKLATPSWFIVFFELRRCYRFQCCRAKFLVLVICTHCSLMQSSSYLAYTYTVYLPNMIPAGYLINTACSRLRNQASYLLKCLTWIANLEASSYPPTLYARALTKLRSGRALISLHATSCFRHWY